MLNPVRRVARRACRHAATQQIGSPSLIGPALPPTNLVPDRGLGARTRPRPDWTGANHGAGAGPCWVRMTSEPGGPPGTSGHNGYGETAGPSSFAARTTAAGVPRRRVRIPPPPPASAVIDLQV